MKLHKQPLRTTLRRLSVLLAALCVCAAPLGRSYLDTPSLIGISKKNATNEITPQTPVSQSFLCQQDWLVELTVNYRAAAADQSREMIFFLDRAADGTRLAKQRMTVDADQKSGQITIPLSGVKGVSGQELCLTVSVEDPEASGVTLLMGDGGEGALSQPGRDLAGQVLAMKAVYRETVYPMALIVLFLSGALICAAASLFAAKEREDERHAH